MIISIHDIIILRRERELHVKINLAAARIDSLAQQADMRKGEKSNAIFTVG
jgi:hypothetical protein